MPGKIIPLLRDAGTDRQPNAEPLIFETAIAACLDNLFSAAVQLVRDASAAQDLVQETCLRAYRAFPSLRHPAKFRSWLFTILYNTARNEARALRRRPPWTDVPIDLLLADEECGLNSRAPERALESPSLSAEVRAALAHLPAPVREAIWLVDVEQFTIAEASEILNLPPGTVASRIYRGHRTLRDRLGAASGSARQEETE